jgi:hypothetical protein
MVQQIMSGDRMPILSGAIPAFEMFMTKWEKLAKDFPHLQPFIQPGLDWAYMYYNRMDRTTAYIIAMCKQLYLSEMGRYLYDDFGSNQSCYTDVMDSETLG